VNFRNRIVDLHIIDALDTKWAEKGFSEALALRFRLRDTKVRIVSHYCWDLQSFKTVIENIRTYRTTYRNPRKAIPFLHIACHGVKDGLFLGDSEAVPWATLSECLLPLQKHMDYTLSLSLSACHGYYGYQLACEEMRGYLKKRPFYLLTGPRASLSTTELISAYAAFYKDLLHSYYSVKRAMVSANRQIRKPKSFLDYSFGVEAFREQLRVNTR
jgi:hypothetical protein